MKVRNHLSKLEKAQVLPIVVIGLLVMIGFAALIIDGGAVMLNRRTAQAAADAGALAGAQRACLNKTDAKAVAEYYATVNNNATTATATVNGKVVTVVATVDHPSFFARIFSQDSDLARAEAAAGCFPIKGDYLMPIAWSCRPPVAGGVFDPELGCKMMSLDWLKTVKPILDGSNLPIPGNVGSFQKDGANIVNVDTGEPASQIYLIMDKISTADETLCKEDLDPTNPLYTTAIICDINNDGKIDIEGGGNRSWLDLNNDGGGTSELRDWIRDGTSFALSPHTWLSGETGNVSALYEAIKDYRLGKVLKLPIFNAICNDKDPLGNPACIAAAHASPRPDGVDTVPGKGSAPMFHVITFDSFYVSCVHIKSGDYCPGFALAQELNPDPDHPGKSLIPDNTPSIEGYFLTNVDNPLDINEECLVNLGNCQVSLTK